MVVILNLNCSNKKKSVIVPTGSLIKKSSCRASKTINFRGWPSYIYLFLRALNILEHWEFSSAKSTYEIQSVLKINDTLNRNKSNKLFSSLKSEIKTWWPTNSPYRLCKNDIKTRFRRCCILVGQIYMYFYLLEDFNHFVDSV